MKEETKTYLVRRLDGLILSCIVTKEKRNKNKRVITEEPEIYIAVNETYSNNNVRWARFDGTITNPRRILKSSITLAQLISPVYFILCQFNWPTELLQKFALLCSASHTFNERDTDKVYYQEIKVNIPDDVQARGVKCVSYNEKFEPVKQAIWEEIIYG